METYTNRELKIKTLANYLKNKYKEVELYNVHSLYGESSCIFEDNFDHIKAFYNDTHDYVDIVGLTDEEFIYVVKYCGDRRTKDKHHVR